MCPVSHNKRKCQSSFVPTKLCPSKIPSMGNTTKGSKCKFSALTVLTFSHLLYRTRTITDAIPHMLNKGKDWVTSPVSSLAESPCTLVRQLPTYHPQRLLAVTAPAPFLEKVSVAKLCLQNPRFIVVYQAFSWSSRSSFDRPNSICKDSVIYYWSWYIINHWQHHINFLFKLTITALLNIQIWRSLKRIATKSPSGTSRRQEIA